ncbi:MAG: alpha/beta hydrolase [Bacteroidota bacterium]
MHLSSWQNSGPYYDHHGHQIFYRTAGQGEALLLIHGFPTASWDWHKVWAQLSNRYQLIAADMIGFGFSDKPRTYNYSIHDQADLQEGLLQSLGIKRYHILAHDYGDTVAQELLARQLEGAAKAEILSVAFLNGGLFPGNHQPRLIQKLLASPLGFLIKRFVNKAKLRSNFQAIFGPNTQPTAQEIEEFWALNTHNDGIGIVHKLIRYMHERVRFEKRWLGALQDTAVPLQLINGGFDPISGRHMAEKYQEVVPNPQVVVLDQVGHYPQVEAPQEVLSAYFQQQA